MDVKKTLNQIADLESKLDKYFDGNISEVIRDMTTQYWTLTTDDVGFSDSNPIENHPDDPDREHIYREEVRHVTRKGEYTLVCIHTCTGDGCEDFIFDNSKEIPEKELHP